MGFGRIVGPVPLALGLLAALASGCGYEDEPAKICSSLDLSAQATATATSDSPTFIAISRGDGKVEILRVCEHGCEGAELEARVIDLDLGKAPDQILLTGSGRWLTYRVDGQLLFRDLEAEDSMPEGGPEQVHELIGALRGGDWLIYRTWGDAEFIPPNNEFEQPKPPPVNESELWAYYVGDLDELPTTEDPEQAKLRPHFRIGGDLRLRVVAMGHRHVVARRSFSDGSDELYLVRIAPARRHDELGSANRGKPLLLARGPEFTRVVITEGPSPAAYGDPWEKFQYEVPTDSKIIATSGEGARAKTLVYEVSDTSEIARFSGAVVSSTLPLDDVAGLDAVSPDGSHVAYVTPRGSLALHSLRDHSECMVRPATGARHVIAGFGADGTLYFESRERGTDQVTHDEREVDVVYAYDTLRRSFTALTDRHQIWRLKAVPARRYEDEEGNVIPWAVVANEGDHAAGPGRGAQALFFDEVSFFTRDDESLWLLEATPGELYSNEDNHLSLRRVQPLTDEGGLRFDAKDADPTVKIGDTVEHHFTHSYSWTENVCVSTSQSTSRTTPWASKCSTPGEPADYLENGLPDGELDGQF